MWSIHIAWYFVFGIIKFKRTVGKECNCPRIVAFSALCQSYSSIHGINTVYCSLVLAALHSFQLQMMDDLDGPFLISCSVSRVPVIELGDFSNRNSQKMHGASARRNWVRERRWGARAAFSVWSSLLKDNDDLENGCLLISCGCLALITDMYDVAELIRVCWGLIPATMYIALNLQNFKSCTFIGLLIMILRDFAHRSSY